MRIGQARRSFLLRCKSEGLSSASVIFYRNQIRYYWRWLYDHQRVNKWLETDTLRTYFAWMQKRVDAGEIQPETADATYRAMRALCRWLLTQGEIASDPFSKIARPKVPAKMPRCIEIDEYSQLVRSIPHAHWTDARDRLAIVILFWCGLRVNELVELRLADIDMEASMLTVRAGKGGDPRYTPLLPVVRTAFFAYIYDRPAVKTQYLFMASNGMGAPLSRGLRESGIRQMLERRCDAAGIKRKNPHSFRHGIAMHLLNDLGADMSFISEILGHKDEKTTEKFYARWKSEGLAKKYAKLVNGYSVE